jgi:hypothetical protein
MQGQVPTIFAVHVIGTVMLDSIFDLHSQMMLASLASRLHIAAVA